MQAVILAGGLGTRLRPLTITRPKHLLPLRDRPMILHLIDSVADHVDEVLVTASYLTEAFQALFDAHELPVAVDLVVEGVPLGTGGALKNLEGRLEGPFLVLNGDVIASLRPEALLAFHEEKGGVGTLALWEVDRPEAFGIVGLGKEGRIERFLEKPAADEVFSRVVNAGMYALETSILEHIPAGRAVSLEREVFPEALGEDLYGMVFTGYWADAGTRESYLTATRILLDERGGGLAKGSIVHPGAGLLDPCFLGRSSTIRGGVVGPYAVLGAECSVDHAKVANSVLLDQVRVARGAIVQESLVGAQVTIGEDSRIEGAVVADGVTIPPGSKHVGERVEA